MKLWLILLLFPQVLFAQIIEDFEDSDLTDSPEWFGDVDSFQIDFDGKNKQLQNNGKGVGKASLLMALSGKTEEWNFTARMDFNPSSSNYSRYYLFTDSEDLKTLSNGYYIQLGGSTGTTDSIALYQQSGSTRKRLIAGRAGTLGKTKNKVHIKVLYINNEWILLSDTTDKYEFIKEGIYKDSIGIPGKYSGIYIQYTSSNRDKIYFDNIYAGAIIKDTIPPEVVRVKNDRNSIDLFFSEKLKYDSIAEKISIINCLIDTIYPLDPFTLKINFYGALDGLIYYVKVEGLSDMEGNKFEMDSFPFYFHTPVIKDVIINEIFPDPEPIVGLPGFEFIELFNSYSKAINLKNWIISDGNSYARFPEYILGSDSFLILCTKGTADTLYSKFGKVLPLSIPSLNNSSDNLFLFSDDSALIDQVSYSSDLFPEEKNDGGYTLEKLNTTNCKNIIQFLPSKNLNGGTPGYKNSCDDLSYDRDKPELFFSGYQKEKIVLKWSEMLDSTTISLQKFDLSFRSDLLLQYNALLHQIDLYPTENLIPGIKYSLKIEGIQDCFTNTLKETVINILIPEIPEKKDIIINEILFNPHSGGVDFIEVYNNSEKIFSLNDLSISNSDTSKLKSLKNAKYFLFNPKEYLVFCNDPELLNDNYFIPDINRIVKFQIPSMNDDEGEINIFYKTELIEHLKYTEDWHHSLLKDKEGVSLERISFSSFNTPDNWTSAAAHIGYASPGYKNSQSKELISSDQEFYLQSELFSPDQDGSNDVLLINYHFNETNYLGNISVYDLQGRLIKRLLKNEITGTEGICKWDGADDSGNKAALGVYLIYAEFHNPSGQSKRFKETIILAYRL